MYIATKNIRRLYAHIFSSIVFVIKIKYPEIKIQQKSLLFQTNVKQKSKFASVDYLYL